MKTALDGTVNVLVPTGALSIGVREADFAPANVGGEPGGGSADEFRRFIAADIARWAVVVRESGVQPE